MLCDWLSLKLPVRSLWTDVQKAVAQRLSNTICIDPAGEIVWSKWPPERLRSDTHQVTVSLTEHYFYISGSPARLGQSNNVFGSADIQGCALEMIRHVRQQLDVWLPELEHWECTRIDITSNLYLDSHARVLEALEILQSVQGGHYRVSSRGSTAYFNRSSDLQAAKAYAKGPHLRYQIKKGQAMATADEVDASMNLLRLELTLGSRWIRRWREQQVGALGATKHRNSVVARIKQDRTRSIWELTEEELKLTADAYWSRIIGQATEDKTMTDDELHSKLQRLAKTPRQGSAAFGTWLQIQGAGVERVKASMSVSTWQRHKKLLFDAGLTWADLSQRKVVALRARAITARPVSTWAELQSTRNAA